MEADSTGLGFGMDLAYEVSLKHGDTFLFLAGTAFVRLLESLH
jgi:hypothetical protein